MEGIDIFGKLPPITRGYLVAAASMTVLSALDFVSPLDLYLNWGLVLHAGQWWRLLTCFLYFGDLKLNVLWSFYLLAFYSGGLEKSTFRKRPADYLWFLIVAAGLVLTCSLLVGSRYSASFLADSLLNVQTYYWCRRNPHERMGFFLLSVEAPYLPWVMALMGMLTKYSVFNAFIGIFVGHVCYFFREVYPLMPTSASLNLLAAPPPLRWLLGQKEDDRY